MKSSTIQNIQSFFIAMIMIYLVYQRFCDSQYEKFTDDEDERSAFEIAGELLEYVKKFKGKLHDEPFYIAGELDGLISDDISAELIDASGENDDEKIIQILEKIRYPNGK